MEEIINRETKFQRTSRNTNKPSTSTEDCLNTGDDVHTENMNNDQNTSSVTMSTAIENSCDAESVPEVLNEIVEITNQLSLPDEINPDFENEIPASEAKKQDYCKPSTSGTGKGKVTATKSCVSSDIKRKRLMRDLENEEDDAEEPVVKKHKKRKSLKKQNELMMHKLLSKMLPKFEKIMGDSSSEESD